MKKAVSILSVLIILLGGSQITLSTHFCGGKVAASKISLTGRIASCGMEAEKETCPLHGNLFTRQCCDDQIQIAGVVNLFTIPLSLSENKIDDFTNYAIPPVINNNLSPFSLNPSFTTFNPPGTYSDRSVRLENICVFRI